jgi:hypothetical protein
MCRIKKAFCKGKKFFFTLTLFMAITYCIPANAQEIVRDSLIIEVEEYENEEDKFINLPFINLFEMELRMKLSPYLVNSICSESIMAFSFTLDSCFAFTKIQYTDSSAPLLHSEIEKVLMTWQNGELIRHNVSREAMKLGSTYIIPISFYFKCTTGKTVSTFKRDYQSMDRFLKSFDWGKTEILDMIIIDLRYKN